MKDLIGLAGFEDEAGIRSGFTLRSFEGLLVLEDLGVSCSGVFAQIVEDRRERFATSGLDRSKCWDRTCFFNISAWSDD